MNRTTALRTIAVAAFMAFAAQAGAQNTSTSEKMNPQPNAGTSVKAPAGVANPTAVENNTQGMTGAQTGCKSASAEMTNGKVEDCKQ